MVKAEGMHSSLEVMGLEKIARYKTNQQNKEQIKNFTYSLLSSGIKEFAIMRHLRYLEVFFDTLDSPKTNLKDITKEQFTEVMARLRYRVDTLKVGRSIKKIQMTEHRRARILITLKKTFRYILGDDAFVPPQLAVIKVKPSREEANKHDEKIADNIITKAEIEKLIDAATSLRDKTILSVLWDSGVRVSELCNLTIRDIDLQKDVSHIRVTRSKTQARPVTILFAAPYLSQYLETRKGAKPDDFLFVCEGTWKYNNAQLGAAGVNKMIKIVTKKAGLDKLHITAHSFRHSSATFNSPYLSSAQMKARYGWSKASDMDVYYSHMTTEMQDNAILNMWGKSREKTAPVGDRECPRCKQVNAVTNLHCSRCGAIMDISLETNSGEDKGNVRELAKEMIKDPEVKQELLKYLALELAKKEKK